MDYFLVAFALLGHAFIWIGLSNRLHSLGVPRWTVKLISACCVFCFFALPIWIAWTYLDRGGVKLPMALYVMLCWIAATATLLRLVALWLMRRPPRIVRYHAKRRAEIDLRQAAASDDERKHWFPVHLPLNETLHLEISEWMLEVPRLPPTLDGLSIVHLSDLHFTGRVGKAYFREVVRISNDLRPEMVCITGDLMDKTECLDWTADTLGRLEAKLGVYYILGNHDRRVDVSRLRRTLNDHGLQDLGGRWRSVEIDKTPVVLIGDERPWFKHAPDLQSCPPPAPLGPVRILLTHTPDRLRWAQMHQVDLMLAGHTHGGQVRIPPLGAIFSPTAQGVRYISGVFHAPPTVLHVSRGISGDVPIRWNCRPEITLLRLRARS